ncbi:MAG TPA: hypothetical protein PKA55_14655 [Rhodoblastus sp.]|nr:hypothetical protein [Rhodoblastus sp.]
MKKRRVRRPVEQGDIDGLCAIYSTLNACKLMFHQSEKQDEKLLETLCKGVADQFPRIVWEGAGVPTLYRLFRIADDWAQRKHKARLLWGAPLMRAKFDSADAFLDRLRAGLEAFDDGAAVWIVGLGNPWHHWTVVERVTGRRVYFFDSWGMKHYRFDSFTLDENAAGEGRGKKIKIDPHQSFLLRVGEI